MPKRVASALNSLDIEDRETEIGALVDGWAAALDPYCTNTSRDLRRAAFTQVKPDKPAPVAVTDLVVAPRMLQHEADYRGALQHWFAQVPPSGQLMITVEIEPQTSEQPAEPNLRARLLDMIEESLGVGEANVLTVETDSDTVSSCELIALVSKIADPGSGAVEERRPGKRPPVFKPGSTRVERARPQEVGRILLLKFDHLGDFIMGLPALERVRASFPDAHITLAVGSWNEKLARSAGIADEIILFDAFPRNSSEEDVNLVGRVKSFAKAVAGSYDLAIDLRSDPDTRFFLRHVDAAYRAGLGTRAQFPFLDIFLPIDITRHEPETAREQDIGHASFASQPFCKRSRYRIHCASEDVSSQLGAVIWGPYRELRPGNYFFEPFLEFDEPREGMLLIDVALNYERAVAKAVTSSADLRLDFTVDKPGSKFEFRIFEPEDALKLGFSFYGGRLVREGAESVLHQSEYLSLLVELVSMRVHKYGLLNRFEPAK